MRKSVLGALLATAVSVVIMASAAVYAASEYSSGSMRGDGMMGHSMMGAGGMMSRMSRMMDGCSAMMQGGSRGSRPNEQWRNERPNPDRDK